MGETRTKAILSPAITLIAVVIAGLTLQSFTGSAQTNVEARAFQASPLVQEEGTEPGKLRRPSGISVGPHNRVYVADTLNHRIQIFDDRGDPIGVIGQDQKQSGGLYLPEDVALSPDGSIYVADTGNNRIQTYTPDGKYKGRIPLEQESRIPLKAGLDSPSGVALDSEGNVYVVNRGSSRIMKFNPQGHLLKEWAEVGSAQGRLVRPSRIAIGPGGTLWVTDTGNHRIQVFSPEGRYLFHFGKAGSSPGELKSPIGIALDGNGNAYVADSGNRRIQKFDPRGNPLTSIMELQGRNMSQFIYPNGLTIDKRGNLYVADSLTHGIQKLVFNPALRLLEQGWVSYEKQDYEAALSLWNQALELDPELAEAMYAIGTLHLKTGRGSAAMKWFKRALDADPSYPQARRSLNRVYLKQYSPIIVTVGIIMTLMIVYVVHRQRKINHLKASAKQLRGEGKIRDTIAVYEKLLEIDRNNLETCKTLSGLYSTEGMEAQGRKVNRTIARLEPENVMALSQIGKSQLYEGKFSRAADTWKKVIRVSPHNSDAYFYLGISEAQLADEESALNHFLKAIDLEEDNPEKLIHTAPSCVERGEIPRAAIKLKLSHSMTPEDKNVEKMIEKLGERYQQALDSLARQRVESSLKAALTLWEQELQRHERFEAAASAFRGARDAAGEELLHETKQEIENGNQEAALPKLQRVLELQPDNQDASQLLKDVRIAVAFQKGYDCYKRENYSQAILYFQQVISIDPRHAEAQKYLRYAHQCLEGSFRTRFKYLDL